MKKEKLIIIGSGPAGLTAALYSSRAELSPMVFEGMTPGGQLMGTTEIENFPAVPKGTTGPSLVNRIREQAQEFGAKTVFENIEKVDFSDPSNLKLWTDEEEYHCKSVIIATGASARWLNLGKGEERFWGKGYTACATCDGAFFREKTVAVVGGGDTACEEAVFLTRFAKKVYLIHRRDELRASKPMQNKVIEHPQIEIIWNSGVTNLEGETLLKSVELTNTSEEKTTLPLDGLFMAIGHSPNTKFLDGVIDLDEKGFIKVTNHTHTNIPSVFVAGDCADPRYKQAIVAAGSGAMSAIDAEHYISE